MYTFAPTSVARRSAQTVLWQDCRSAGAAGRADPELITADEVWDYLPKVDGREASVHLAQFPEPERIFSQRPALLFDEWKILFALRENVLSTLEELRQKKVIGKALEADLEIFADGDLLALLLKNRESLKEFFNVSQSSPASLSVIQDCLKSRN